MTEPSGLRVVHGVGSDEGIRDSPRGGISSSLSKRLIGESIWTDGCRPTCARRKSITCGTAVGPMPASMSSCPYSTGCATRRPLSD